MKLYIGNLSYITTEETLRKAFSNYADISSLEIMRDRFTQQSKGFGFVEIEDEIRAQRAIGGMNGKEIDGRRIRVSEAVEKPVRNSSSNRRNFGRRDDDEDSYSNDGFGWRKRRVYEDDYAGHSYRRNDSESADYNKDWKRKGSDGRRNFYASEEYNPRRSRSENFERRNSVGGRFAKKYYPRHDERSDEY